MKHDPPLQIDVDHPDKDKVRIKLNGVYVSDFVMVDVLGCCGVRYARDDQGFLMQDGDGCAMTEKLWGNFAIEWKPEPKPKPESEQATDYDSYDPFFGLPYCGPF